MAPSPAVAPTVIAHRGASGYRPEHTLAAYRLAIAQGADMIEPDLVCTADGVLVARHENELGRTTDIASRADLADRRTTKLVDGEQVTGWFSEDLTFAELRTLRAVERLPELRPASTVYDGRFLVPSLDEVLDLARTSSHRLGRTIGVYIEAKSPEHFRSVGLPLEQRLVDRLDAHGHCTQHSPVVLQSFAADSLRELAALTALRLTVLLDDIPADDALSTPEALRELAAWAWAVGPSKDRVLPRGADGSLSCPSSFVADAHAAELAVHVWTFRAETPFLPTGLDATSELLAFVDAGIDGLFTDQPDLAVAAVRALRHAAA